MWNRVSNNQSGGNRPVCSFFLQGKCKFGDSCRNYHPNNAPSSNQNRFGALSNSNQNTSGNTLPYSLNVDAIRSDLTIGDDKPGWPLSCYGPGREAPRQLIEGAIEQSMEELRAQYYIAKAAGSTQQYEQSEAAALQQAEQQARQILSNIDAAVKFVIDGKDQHPNREDVTQKTGNFPWAPLSTSASTSTASTLVGSTSASQPNAFGAASTGFGTQAASSGFGRPSAMGSSSAFGRPSALGGGTAFGAPSSAPANAMAGGNTTFGNASSPSPFGQNANNNNNNNPSPFGQNANAGGATSAFGRPSTLGGFGGASSAASPSPFTQAANNTNTGTAFGKPSVPGSSPFAPAASNNNNTTGTTFGQPSGPSPSPFAAAPSSAAPAFGQTSAAPANTTGFGQSSAAPANNTSFGQSSANPAANPFSNNNANANANAANRPSPFGAAANTTQQTFGINSAHPQTSQTQARTGPLTSFRGRPIEHLRVSPNDPTDTTTAPFYTNAQGRKERIWMPDGAPGPNPDVESPDEGAYQGDVGSVLRRIYDFAKESEMGFKDGFVPEIPPKREWVSFEL